VALPLLANPAELAASSGRSASDGTLLAALREASRAFRGAVRHEVTQRRDEGYQLEGNGARALLLPRPFPIVVDEDDNTFEISIDGDLVPAERYRLNRRTGLVQLIPGYVWRRGCDLTVTYTHGYLATVPTGSGASGPLVGLPEDIQGVVIERALIEMNVTPGVTQRSVLGDSISFGGSAVGATQRWSDVVAVYFEPTGVLA
jgi:hypothetical protein